MRFVLAAALSLIALAPWAQAVETTPQLVPVALKRAFIPVGFDDNDQSQIVVTGEFSDSCYKLGPTKVTKTAAGVEVLQQAYRYGGVCLDTMVSFSQVVELGLMRSARHEITDATSKKTLGDLSVAKATRPEADDFVYAPVQEALILEERGGAGPALYLTGNYPSKAVKIREVRVLNYADVIVVQPIMEYATDTVESRDAGERPRFEIKQPLKNLPKGAFLLHVRSMNGKALNIVEEIESIRN